MSSTLQLTLDEYDRMVRRGAFEDLGRRVELLRGELTQMNPAGPLHDDLLNYLINWSVRQADPERVLVTSQTGLDLAPQASRPEPDLMWVRAGRYRERHPGANDVFLAIEVADRSLATDRELKRQLYAEAGIGEYWIVDCQAEVIHVHFEPHDADYRQQQTLAPPQHLAPQCQPSAILRLDQLFG